MENAVIHGAAALCADSTITLTGACDRAKGRFTVRIADQGQGMGPEALERLRGRCIQEVKKTGGAVTFADAMKYQKGE